MKILALTMTMMFTSMPFLKSALLLAALFPLASGQFTIQPEEFYMGATSGLYDAIIDVRSEGEWSDGHVSRSLVQARLSLFKVISSTHPCFCISFID